MTHLETIKLLSKLEPTYDHTWVGSNPSRAFLICVGAGPWKVNRRQVVQGKALEWLGDRDLGNIHYGHFDYNVYPFKWQNNMLFNMLISLRSRCTKFTHICNEWKDNKNHWKEITKEFFNMCGTTENGTKVLWLFVRDYLQFPAFPIDRWIKRALETHKLPQNSWQMVDLCIEAGVDPNRLNRALFSGSNPDFQEDWNE